MPTVLEAMGQFLDWWIGLVIIVLLYYLFKFLFMFGEEQPAADKLGAAAQRIRNARNVGRQLQRSVSRVYRLNHGAFLKNLKTLQNIIRTHDLSRITHLLSEGKKELERKGELQVYIDYLTEQLDQVAHATRKSAIERDLTTLKNQALVLFDELENAYTDVGKALRRKDWTSAQQKIELCAAKLTELTRDLVGLEAVERRITA